MLKILVVVVEAVEMLNRRIFPNISRKKPPQNAVVKLWSNVKNFGKPEFCVDRVEACGVEVDETWKILWNRIFLKIIRRTFHIVENLWIVEAVNSSVFPQRFRLLTFPITA